MNAYSLFHVSDAALLRNLAALVKQDRATTAQLLAHISEIEERRLYAPAGYPSMFAYCVGELHLSDEVALKRIRAARKARQFPEIFQAVAEGRLHLTGVVLLGPHLSRENVHELLSEATHKSKAQIELLIARRFPREDVATQVRPLGSPSGVGISSPGPIGIMGQLDPDPPGAASDQAAQSRLQAQEPAPGHVGAMSQPAPRPANSEAQVDPDPLRVPREAPYPKIKPLAPERYAVQFTMGQAMHEKLEYARALLSHEMPSGNIPEILERALDSLISSLEKRKFAAVTKPRKVSGNTNTGTRHIPAEVKRAVRERDQGRCTFVSESGQRCESRNFLEYDHVIPVAKGGRASLENLRLRCRAHNQYEAGCAFGHGFMHEKRERARSGRTQNVAGDVRGFASRPPRSG